VASKQELLAQDIGDLWDSGKRDSSQSIQHIYRGQPLHSSQRVWWKVVLWDQQGELSVSHEFGWWEMGLLSHDDWHGQWITSPPIQTRSELEAPVEPEMLPGLYLRTTFLLRQHPRQVRLYATAKGVYEVHINGHKVGNALLSPGWTDYRKRIQYQSYDITSLLHTGENAVGAILGTGWYCGHAGFQFNGQKKNAHYGSQPALLLQMRVDYEDGSVEWIGTDQSWKANTGPIVFSDLLHGETYDARAELPGWDETGFSDGDWHTVQEQEESGSFHLVADLAQPVCLTETIMPQAISTSPSGASIVDFGQNMVGWVRLQVQGTAGTRVQLRFGEMLTPEGNLYTANLRGARQCDTYILKGYDVETFEPHFTFHGFRYVEVAGYPGTLSLQALTGCVIHSDLSVTGSFTCSHPLVNQLQHNITWGQRSNFISIPTDCPQRDERLGWLGDGHIFLRTATYNRDVSAFFRKWMYDIIDAQSEQGAFSDVAPRLSDLADGAPGWGDAGIIVPWTLYQVYGDLSLLEEHYEAMKRWIDYVHRANPELLWKNQRHNDFGDWLSIAADTSKDVLATAYFAYDALLFSKIAHVLSRTRDEEIYHELYERIAQAFCAAFVDEQGHVQGETQTGYVLALHMQLLPQKQRAQAAAHLVAAIKQAGGHLSTGFVGVSYLCPVLTEAGYADVAYQLLTQESYPSWGYTIGQGATTIWERWDGWTEEHGFQDPGMNSFNHYSLGSVGQWLYQYVAGIDVSEEEPAYRHSVIRPHPGGGLTHARADYASMYGTIVSEWQSDEKGTWFAITIPANTTATVVLPVGKQASLTEGDTPIQDAYGVYIVRHEQDKIILRVESGEYFFAYSTPTHFSQV
jgi:alpha-L-rhamnosidase